MNFDSAWDDPLHDARQEARRDRHDADIDCDDDRPNHDDDERRAFVVAQSPTQTRWRAQVKRLHELIRANPIPGAQSHMLCATCEGARCDDCEQRGIVTHAPTRPVHAGTAHDA